MCCFKHSRLISVRQVSEDKPVVAYRTMLLTSEGKIYSPYFRTEWQAKNNWAIRARNYWRKATKPSTKEGYGIYAWKRLSDTSHTRSVGNCSVKVHLWGEVHSFNYGRSVTGYLAEHAEIVHVEPKWYQYGLKSHSVIEGSKILKEKGMKIVGKIPVG